MASQWGASSWTASSTWESDHLVQWVEWGWIWEWKVSGTTCSPIQVPSIATQRGINEPGDHLFPWGLLSLEQDFYLQDNTSQKQLPLPHARTSVHGWTSSLLRNCLQLLSSATSSSESWVRFVPRALVTAPSLYSECPDDTEKETQLVSRLFLPTFGGTVTQMKYSRLHGELKKLTFFWHVGNGPRRSQCL